MCSRRIEFHESLELHTSSYGAPMPTREDESSAMARGLFGSEVLSRGSRQFLLWKNWFTVTLWLIGLEYRSGVELLERDLSWAPERGD